jgi:biotin transport system permease protein
MLTGLYRPGDTWVHRATPGAKLLALLALSSAVLVWRSPAAVLAGAGVSVAGYLAAGLGVRDVVAQVWPLRWFVLALAPFQAWAAGWSEAFVVVGTMVVAVAAASLVTVTTAVSDMMDAVVGGLRPLRRWGVDPERVGLLLALTVRAVPVIADTARQSREARRARGLERSPRALLVPLALRSIRHAQRVGEALAARGYDD